MSILRSATQAGFSIIEMMVASTIGLLLIAATGQIFLSNKQSFTAQEALGNIQDGARLAMHFLQRDLRQAGYPAYSALPPIVYNTTGACTGLASAQWAICTPTAGTGTVNGGGNAADRIEVQMQSRRDCLGRDPVNTGYEANQFYLRNRYFVETDADGISRLKCQSFQLNPDTKTLEGGTYAAAANAGGVQPLVDGIETLQFLYGIDTTSDPNSPDNLPQVATRYLRADQITTDNDWLRVVSVRAGIMASSVTSTGSENTADNAAQRYLVLDAPVFTRSDLLRRRVFVSTIQIRNHTP